jgi:hypothetical protein
MFRWLQNRRRLRRATAYLRAYPEDEPIVQTTLATIALLGMHGPREIASTTAGRKISDEEWSKISPRWERAWAAIVR